MKLLRGYYNNTKSSEGFLFLVLKSVLLSRHEEIRVLYVREKFWGYCPLTNEINAGGYLYLYWYSKGTLHQSTWSLTRKRSARGSIVSETGSRCDIDCGWFFNVMFLSMPYIRPEGLFVHRDCTFQFTLKK